MPSMINCGSVMGLSHASHTSPSAGPPQNLGMLVERQATVLKFLADEDTNLISVH
jgi:hypothetical protein